MKVFTCKDFQGYNPVGVSAVIVAATKNQALKMLAEALEEKHLTLGDATLQELDTQNPGAHILQDGDY